MTTEFSLNETSVDARTHVVTVRGEIDLYTAPDLRERINDAIDAGKVHVVVDLTGTTFIDSTTLGVLIGAIKRLRVRDGNLVIACADPAILRVFEITGLNQVVGIKPSLDEALDAAAQPAGDPSAS
jgi:anti-sigma B factor antagonist